MKLIQSTIHLVVSTLHLKVKGETIIKKQKYLNKIPLNKKPTLLESKINNNSSRNNIRFVKILKR